MRVGLGTSRKSNRITNWDFPSLEAFALFLRKNRSGAEDWHNFTPSPMETGVRGKKYAEPSNIVTLDVDERLTRSECDRLLEVLAHHSAIAYETRKSTTDAPRLRVIVETNRPIAHDEYPAYC